MRKQATLLIAVILLWPAAGSRAAPLEYPRGDLLLEPAELLEPEVSSRFVVLDVRGKAEYEEEHLPAAQWVDHDEWKTAFGDGTDAAGWSARIGKLGIDLDSNVVVYDNNAMKDAARIWWILRYWGVADVRLLNGGWNAWKAAGLKTTSEPAAPPRATNLKLKPRPRRLVTLQQLRTLLKGRTPQIVDARSENEFCGIDAFENKRAGAIPGAKHLEWSDLIDQTTQRFKSAEQLRRLFNQHGIDLKQPTVGYCQSGGRASVMVFALELMGARNVRNYYHGWSEWGNQADTPVMVPEKETP